MDTEDHGRTQVPPPLVLPPGTPGWIDEELVRKTIRVWQPHFSGALTPEDAVEILLNVGHLFGAMGLTGGSQGGRS